ncbi:Oligoendopeptidase F [Methanosarcina siciliae T4/M]|uniref:Oligoendopeptidase F n=1 Tax=Methanosarcina siciliae T4/M TaxID=1434120 RepID=A0A0E3P8T9_9EURY|nr:hypothetical protein [Methanosarcina siciliae]AKB30323.1 Oligoendopeptidase F [Methanosarcina siciliae T4/M]
MKVLYSLSFFVFPGSGVPVETGAVLSSGTTIEEYEFEELNPDNVTTECNDTYFFSSREAAQEELERLKQRSAEISEIFRPEFGELAGLGNQRMKLHTEAVSVLSQHMGEYQNYLFFQPMVTEFEHKAHQLCAEKGYENGTSSNERLSTYI